MRTQTDYDVLIVGGGMVGSALACALGDSPLRVGVIERTIPTAPSLVDYGLRVSAITSASKTLFESVGAWPLMKQQRVSPFQKMRVWDAGGNGELHFDCAEIGQPYLGFIIENQVMQWALHQRLQGFSNVQVLSPLSIEAIDESDPAQCQVDTGDGKTLSTRLLVAADGARSRIRELAGFSSHGWSYRQLAIVATVQTERPHQATAWQRFLPTGPLAFLPLDDPHYCSIVWSVDLPEGEAVMDLSDPAFVDALMDGFAGSLGQIESVSERAAFPLVLRQADHYIRPRLALIGDAAHSVHPMAGQGVNLGYADAAVLAETLIHAQECGRDIGDRAGLRRYERWRKTDNSTMLAVTDGLKRLFAAPSFPFGLMRNTGMNLIDHAGPLKRQIMRYATGLAGEFPVRMRAQYPAP